MINELKGHDYEDTMEEFKKSCYYRCDVDLPTLARHLQLLQDVYKRGNEDNYLYLNYLPSYEQEGAYINSFGYI